jgi:hypothetical protein
VFSGFGEVSELLKQIIAESDEGVPEGVVVGGVRRGPARVPA